jgi:hypothetical protein
VEHLDGRMELIEWAAASSAAADLGGAAGLGGAARLDEALGSSEAPQGRLPALASPGRNGSPAERETV